jgi:hypothetical protein
MGFDLLRCRARLRQSRANQMPRLEALRPYRPSRLPTGDPARCHPDEGTVRARGGTGIEDGWGNAVCDPSHIASRELCY